MADNIKVDVDPVAGLVRFRVRRELDVVPFTFTMDVVDIKRVMAGILLSECGATPQANGGK